MHRLRGAEIRPAETMGMRRKMRRKTMSMMTKSNGLMSSGLHGTKSRPMGFGDAAALPRRPAEIRPVGVVVARKEVP